MQPIGSEVIVEPRIGARKFYRSHVVQQNRLIHSTRTIIVLMVTLDIHTTRLDV